MMERGEQQRPLLPRAVDVTLESPRGRWAGKAIDLGPSRAKVALVESSVNLQPRTIVQLRIALPDGNPPLSLPARVMETDSDGVSLYFFNVRDEAQQQLKDFLLSFQSRSDGSPNSEPHTPIQSPMPPESLEATRPAEGAATADRLADGNTGTPKESQSGLEKLLGQVGLPNLCLPSNGVLSPQWRRFLEQLGPRARSNRPAGADGSNVGTSRDNKSRHAPSPSPR